MNPAVLASSETFPITFIASVLIWVMVLFVVALWAYKGSFTKGHLAHAFLAIAIAWGVTNVIKSLFPGVRPFELNGDLPLTLTIPTDATFPSTHAAVAFGLASSVWLHDRRVGLLLVFMASLVALGRVLANVHNYFDILVGAALGVTISIFLKRVGVFHTRKRKRIAS